MNTLASTITRQIASSWWVTLIRGLCGVVIGLYALFMPDLTVMLFIQFMGAYFLVDGCFSLAAVMTGRVLKGERAWVVIRSLLEVIAGLVIFSSPVLSAYVVSLYVIYFTAACLFVFGISDIYYGIKLRKEIANEFSYIVAGILSVALGTLCAFAPGLAGATILTFIGLTAVVLGIWTISLSFKLRHLNKVFEDTSKRPPDITTHRPAASH